MTNMNHTTEQKTAIVTSASRGIGHAVAERFRSLGWRVITVSRSPIPGGCPRSQEHNTHVAWISDLSQIGQRSTPCAPCWATPSACAGKQCGRVAERPGGSRVNR